MFQLGVDDRFELPGVGPHLFEHRPNNTLALIEQRREKVDRLHLRIAGFAREFLRPLHRFLGLNRQFVESECHKTKVRCPLFVVRCPKDNGPVTTDNGLVNYFLTSNSASTTSSSPAPVAAPSVVPP